MLLPPMTISSTTGQFKFHWCPLRCTISHNMPFQYNTTQCLLFALSIFFYLMDPLGQFVDAFGKATSAEQVAEKVLDSMRKWEAAGGNVAAGL